MINLNDLIIMDHGSKHILQANSEQRVDILIQAFEIQQALQDEGYGSDLNYNNNGLAINKANGGFLYFTADGWDGANDATSVLRYGFATEELEVVIQNATIIAETGNADATLRAIAFHEGWLYAVESYSDSVLKMHPETGAVYTLTTQAAFEALAGITSVSLVSGPIVNDEGKLYVASDDTPPALFEVDVVTGTPTVVIDHTLSDPDVYMDFHPDNGDIVIADDTLDAIMRVTPAGAISTYISTAEIESLLSGSADLEGGVTFHNRSLYVAEENDDVVLKFDIEIDGRYVNGNGSVYLEKETVQRRTGTAPDYDGGIGFFEGALPQDGKMSPDTRVKTQSNPPFDRDDRDDMAERVDYYIQDRLLGSRKMKDGDEDDINTGEFIYYEGVEDQIELDINTRPSFESVATSSTPTPPTPPTPLFATDDTSILYSVDPTTGVRTPIGPCGVPDMRSLAVDPTSGILYGVTGYPDGGGPLTGRIWVIDTITGLASPAPSQISGGACPGSGSVFDPTGQMFAMEGAGCSSGRYHAVDKTTGLSSALLATLNFGTLKGQSLVQTAAGPAYYSMGTDIYPIILATGVLGPPVPLSSGPIRDMCELSGTIYGVRIDASVMGTLCTVHPTTGLVTTIGASLGWLGIAAP